MHLQMKPGRIFAQDEAGELIAEITFTEREPGICVIEHTFVAPKLRGQGVASNLMEQAVQRIIADGCKIRPSCSYAVSWLERHQEFAAYLG